MTPITPPACVNEAGMRELLAARLESSAAIGLSDHLLQCQACLGRLRQSQPVHALVTRLMTLARGANRALRESVLSLIDRLEVDPTGADGAPATTSPPAGTAPCIPAMWATTVEPTNRPEAWSAVSAAVGRMEPPQAPDELGRLAQFRVLRVIGSGGMGIVFHAEDLALHRPVALKTLKPDLRTDPVVRARFLQEARVAGRLIHDHIVTVYHVGEVNDVPFMAMQLLEGGTLEDKLRWEGRLPTADALRIARELATGLEFAHRQGVIHRDVKPANVWLEAGSGRVKVLDFGLARRVDAGAATLSEVGAVAGTPAYMAPEQARGQAMDQRADLFSLGCVLLHTLSGILPFSGLDVFSLLTSLVADPPRGLDALPGDLPPVARTLLDQLLAKTPDRRPTTTAAVVAQLALAERQLAGMTTGRSDSVLDSWPDLGTVVAPGGASSPGLSSARLTPRSVDTLTDPNRSGVRRPVPTPTHLTPVDGVRPVPASSLNPRVRKAWEQNQRRFPYPVNAIGVRIDPGDERAMKLWKAEGMDRFMLR